MEGIFRHRTCRIDEEKHTVSNKIDSNKKYVDVINSLILLNGF